MIIATPVVIRKPGVYFEEMKRKHPDNEEIKSMELTLTGMTE